MIYMFLVSIVLVIVDQVTKNKAVLYLKDKQPISVMGNFFKLTYVENRGAAFGILQNKKVFFILISIFVTLGLIYYIVKYNREINILSKLSLTFLLGGTIGNFIDRVKQNYVVDFLSFNFGSYSFPVFNFADVFIVVGTILLMILIIFEKDSLEI